MGDGVVIEVFAQSERDYLNDISAITWDCSEDVIKVTDGTLHNLHAIAERVATRNDETMYILAYEVGFNYRLIQNSPRYIIGYNPHTETYMVPEMYRICGILPSTIGETIE